MARMGIVQGRLTAPVRGIQAFPRDHWREEFAAAREADIAFIEWIVDEYGFDVNPLLTDKGIAEMQQLMYSSNVAVDSVCADCFMDWPLLKCSGETQEERILLLLHIFGQVKKLGARSIVLPFVDASAMDTPEEIQSFVTLMRMQALPEAERLNLEIHLETSLPPMGVAQLLEQLPHPLFWINYDSGNSASLGYQPADEFAAYGARIGSFHIKDRKLGGTTVPLGTGDTDFAALAQGLREHHYQRNFVLQVARGEVGDEINWARHNSAYAERYLLAEG